MGRKILILLCIFNFFSEVGVSSARAPKTPNKATFREPVRADFNSRKEFDKIHAKWRKARDVNNDSVRRSREAYRARLAEAKNILANPVAYDVEEVQKAGDFVDKHETQKTKRKRKSRAGKKTDDSRKRKEQCRDEDEQDEDEQDESSTAAAVFQTFNTLVAATQTFTAAVAGNHQAIPDSVDSPIVQHPQAQGEQDFHFQDEEDFQKFLDTIALTTQDFQDLQDLVGHGQQNLPGLQDFGQQGQGFGQQDLQGFGQQGQGFESLFFTR